MGHRRHRGHSSRIAVALLGLLAGAILLSCGPAFRSFPPSSERPRSALERARQFAHNYDHARAYAAFSRALGEPGSVRDHAEAEIGAAVALSWLERTPEAIARLRASAKARAGTREEPPILAALAGMSRRGRGEGVDHSEARGLWRRAVEGYRRIAAAAGPTRDAVDAELGAADCLRELGESDAAVAELEAAEKKFRNPHDRPRILLRLAHFYDDERALDVYRGIVSAYPGTLEAADARLSQGSALDRLGREEDALAIYERVWREMAGTEQGVRALSKLGLHYNEREERDRAAVYYRKIVEEYPADWFWTRMARSSLEEQTRYIYSPLYDKLNYRIQHSFVEGVLHIESLGPLGLNPLGVTLATSLTAYFAHLGWLAICLILLAVFGRLAPPSHEPPLLRRHWTIRRLVIVLLSIWTLTLLLQVVSGSLLFKLPFSLSTRLDGINEVLVGGVMIAAVLWRESPRALFAIPRRSLLRTVRILAVSGLAVLILMIAVHNLYAWLVQTGRTSEATLWVSHGADAASPWWYVIPYYLFFALGEECLFRGAVQQAFKGRTATWAAALLSSLLFAQDHMYPVWASVWVFALGAVMVWLVEKTKSLTPPTIVHTAVNLFMFALRR